MQFPSFAEPRVVHSDDSLVVILKPERMHSAGLPSQASAGPHLCDWAFARFPELRESGGERSARTGEGGLLNRLDFETSGLVLFARSPDAFSAFLAAQKRGEVEKEYILWAAPAPGSPEPQGSRPDRVEPRGIDAERWRRALASTDSGGLSRPGNSLPAPPEANLLSLAEVMAEGLASGSGRPLVEGRFRPFGPGSARVACDLEEAGVPGRGERKRARRRSELYRTEFTDARVREDRLEFRVMIRRGFRHQIRAHLAWVGLPILGDSLYGGRGFPRLCLHACRVSLPRPGAARLVLEA